MFVRSGTTWVQEAKIITPGSIQFANAISICGDTIAFGHTAADTCDKVDFTYLRASADLIGVAVSIQLREGGGT